MLTREQITSDFQNLGIEKGDIVLSHSSFKSLGDIDGGAQTVIDGIMAAVGEEGTLVFPTFTQKNFNDAYKTWHIDKESDTGYLTNYFRKLPQALRSDQATHSVAALGRMAKEITKTHGITGKRFGNFGDTPFAADSPWEKMYKLDAKVIMIGVDERYITFRHYAEYCYIEKLLEGIKGHPYYEKMKEELWSFGKPGVWPHTENKYTIKCLEEKNLVRRGKCGNAELLCVGAKDFVDFTLNALECKNRSILKIDDRYWNVEDYIDWENKVEEMQK